MSCNFNELIELRNKLEQAVEDVPKLQQEIVEEIANEFLEDVKKRTPKTKTNKLANSWKKRIVSTGSNYVVEVYNDCEYSKYVEYGKRIGDSGWQNGKFMMTITKNMIEQRMDKIAQSKLDNFLKGVFE